MKHSRYCLNIKMSVGHDYNYVDKNVMHCPIIQSVTLSDISEKIYLFTSSIVNIACSVSSVKDGSMLAVVHLHLITLIFMNIDSAA